MVHGPQPWRGWTWLFQSLCCNYLYINFFAFSPNRPISQSLHLPIAPTLPRSHAIPGLIAVPSDWRVALSRKFDRGRSTGCISPTRGCAMPLSFVEVSDSCRALLTPGYLDSIPSGLLVWEVVVASGFLLAGWNAIIVFIIMPPFPGFDRWY